MARISFLLMMLLALLSCIPTTFAQQQDFDALAHRIIHTTAGVAAGEVVIIHGGQHTVSLMEALAVEVTKAGAFPLMMLNTDRANQVFWDQPEAYLKQQDPSVKAMIQVGLTQLGANVARFYR